MKIIIEIQKDSKLKYEYDKSTNSLILDRVLHNTNNFPIIMVLYQILYLLMEILLM